MEDSFAELILSFRHVGSGDHTGVVSFGSKRLCLLSHLMDSGSLTDLEYTKNKLRNPGGVSRLGSKNSPV